MTSVPPGANKSYPTFWSSALAPNASYTTLKGSDVIFLIASGIVDIGRYRSRGWVAPKERTRELLCGDTVVMIGENPESLAS